MFGHILWGYSLKFRPEKEALYMVGTSNLGSWNGHWYLSNVNPGLINPVKAAISLERYHKKVSFIMTFLGEYPLIFINHGLAKSGVDIIYILISYIPIGLNTRMVWFWIIFGYPHNLGKAQNCLVVYLLLLKHISQLELLFPIYGKKNVPNHQPDMVSFTQRWSSPFSMEIRRTPGHPMHGRGQLRS